MKNKILRRITSLALAGCMAAGFTVAPFAATFADVPDGHWANSYVERAVENGLVNGYGDGKYGVNDEVKRSEWSKVIVGLLYPENAEALTDEAASSDPWWTPWVTAAKDADLLKYTDFLSYFGPDGWSGNGATRALSRYDMAQIIYNAAKLFAWDSGDVSNVAAQIGDWGKVSDTHYSEAVAYCYASGLINGMDDKGTFDGYSSMTRGQAAAVLCRLLDVLDGTHNFAPNTGNSATSSTVAERLTVSASTRPGYKYDITVPGDVIPGKLANGADITDANILAMLGELEEIFPAGTIWGGDGNTLDKYYYSSKALGNGGGCLSWAGMTADLLYGVGANYTTHNDLGNVKCGDVVHLYNAETGREHWTVVMGTGTSASGNPYFITCDGNVNGNVSWNAERGTVYTQTSYPNSTIYILY